MSLFVKRSEATTLEDLKKEWAECTQCPFYAQRSSVIIGQGDPEKTVLYIAGQAPGTEEDKAGVPFVGPGGILCKDLFKKKGIPSIELFWSNVICCKPFKDAKIRKDWINNCWDRVETELRIVKPRGIVAIGRPAAERFLTSMPKTGEVRGIKFKYQGILGITITHPAVLLRHKGKAKKEWENTVDKDMDLVRELYDKCKQK